MNDAGSDLRRGPGAKECRQRLEAEKQAEIASALERPEGDTAPTKPSRHTFQPPKL